MALTEKKIKAAKVFPSARDEEGIQKINSRNWFLARLDGAYAQAGLIDIRFGHAAGEVEHA